MAVVVEGRNMKASVAAAAANDERVAEEVVADRQQTARPVVSLPNWI